MEHRKSEVFMILLVVCTSVAYARTPSKIVNDEDADIKELAYFASIPCPLYDGQNCRGFILDETHILTAAHCAYEFMGSTYQDIFVIEGNADEYNQAENHLYSIMKIIWHRNYAYGQSFLNDIAILTVDRPITFDDFAQPMKPPTCLQGQSVMFVCIHPVSDWIRGIETG